MVTIYSGIYAKDIVEVMQHPQPDRFTLVNRDGTVFELTTNFSSLVENIPTKHAMMAKLKTETDCLTHVHYSEKTKTYYCMEATENGPEVCAISYTSGDSIFRGGRPSYNRKDYKIPTVEDVRLAGDSDTIIYFNEESVYTEDGKVIYRQASETNEIVDAVSKDSDLFILTKRELIRIRDGGVFAVEVSNSKGTKLKIFNDLIGISSATSVDCYERDSLKHLRFATGEPSYMVLGDDYQPEEIYSYALLRTLFEDTVHVVLSTESGIYGTLVKYPKMFKNSLILLGEDNRIIIFDCSNTGCAQVLMRDAIDDAETEDKPINFDATVHLID